uniref:CCHC-type domain-containing protein n=1 Tax=Strigamia maritima TaxID=126957 RepID=T1IQD8_STRMM
MRPRYRFMFTGFRQKDTDQRAHLVNKIQRLGGIYYEAEHFKLNCTHVICARLCRSVVLVKFLCACAAGKWVVTPEFIEKSFDASGWLKEEDYEWKFSDLPINANDALVANLLPGNIEKDYLLAKHLSYLSANWIIETFINGSILIAGGAKVVTKTPPVFDFSLISPSNSDDNDIKFVLVTENQSFLTPIFRSNVLCISTDYIRNFLLKDVKDYSTSCIFESCFIDEDWRSSLCNFTKLISPCYLIPAEVIRKLIDTLLLNAPCEAAASQMYSFLTQMLRVLPPHNFILQKCVCLSKQPTCIKISEKTQFQHTLFLHFLQLLLEQDFAFFIRRYSELNSAAGRPMIVRLLWGTKSALSLNNSCSELLNYLVASIHKAALYTTILALQKLNALMLESARLSEAQDGAVGDIPYNAVILIQALFHHVRSYKLSGQSSLLVLDSMELAWSKMLLAQILLDATSQLINNAQLWQKGIVCPVFKKLNELNYVSWKRDMLACLASKGLSKFIDPKHAVAAGATAADVTLFETSQSKAGGIIYLGIEDKLKCLLDGLEGPADRWDKLAKTYEPKSKARISRLLGEFHLAQMKENESIILFLNRITQLARDLSLAGKIIPDDDIAYRMTCTLPSEYHNVVSIMHRWDDAQFTAANVEKTLIEEFESLKSRELLGVNPNNSSDNSALSTNQKNPKRKQNKEIICFNCGIKGHYSSDCRKKPKKEIK